jgi:hypothetical protein
MLHSKRMSFNGASASLKSCADTDGDGVVNCQDGCPGDASKVQPGVCGCGVPDDNDEDSDGTADCIDGCPSDPKKESPGICGCGTSDDDSDGDGIPDCMQTWSCTGIRIGIALDSSGSMNRHWDSALQQVSDRVFHILFLAPLSSALAPLSDVLKWSARPLRSACVQLSILLFDSVRPIAG